MSNVGPRRLCYQVALTPSAPGLRAPMPDKTFGIRDIFDRRGIFALGMLVLAFAVFGPTTWAFFHRAVPIETDDALAYLLRAQQLAECWRQDCPAYLSIERMLFAGDHIRDNAIEIANEKNTVLFFHAPLQSLILAGLKALGVGWFAGMWSFTFFGAAVIVVSIGAFLRTLFGATAAGIAAVLVGTTYFVGHGLMWIVPSNISLMLGLLGVAVVVRYGQRAAVWIFLIAATAILMHVIGRVTAALIVVAYLAQLETWRWPVPRLGRVDLALVAAISTLAVGYTLLPFLVDRPHFENFSAGPWGWQETKLIILGNIEETIRVTLRSTEAAAGALGFFIAFAYCTVRLEGRGRRVLMAIAAFFVGVCGLSIFHISPRIPGEVFARIWVPTSIVFLGCVSYALLHYASTARPLALLSKSVLVPLVAGRALPAPATPANVAAAFVFVACLAGSALHVLKGAYLFDTARVTATVRYDFAFNPDQIGIVHAGGCGTVWYARREVLYAYLLFGAADCKAHVASYETASTRLSAPGVSAPDWFVWLSPVANNQGRHRFAETAPLVLSEEPPGTCRRETFDNRLWLRVSADGDDTLVAYAGDRKVATADVRKGETKWIELKHDFTADPKLRIVSVSGRLKFAGIRRGEPGRLAWPWDQRIRVEFTLDIPKQQNVRRTVSFDTSAIVPAGHCATVVDDQGFSVLARRD